jgi:hypothetical protein
MKNLTPQFWILLIVCIISGVMIALMDTSPNWDDTGVTVGAILIITFLTGAIRPDFAWLWALIIGGSVFGFNMASHYNYGSAVALVFAFAGAYAGFFMRKIMK